MKLSPEEAHALEDPVVKKLCARERQDALAEMHDAVSACQKECADLKAQLAAKDAELAALKKPALAPVPAEPELPKK